VRETSQGPLPPSVLFGGVGLAFAGVTLASGAPTPLLVFFEHKWGFHAGALTIAFAIYAFGLLLALLVFGSLSDYIGRRPVLIGALLIQLVAMAMFFFASGIGWLIAARAVQGIATGAAFSAFTAALVELAPAGHKELGAIIGSAAPTAGLALGALLTGAAVQFTDSPAKIVFATLAVVTALGIGVAILWAETAGRRPGARRALRPELSIPRTARREFASAAPLQIGAWMQAGLFMGLMPTIIRTLFAIDSGLLNGATVAVYPGTATVTGLLVGRVAPRDAARSGGAATAAGAALVMLAIGTSALPLLLIGALVGGFGFGSSYSGSLRSITPGVEPHQMAGVFAALFSVAYVAFGVPVIIAGQLIPRAGLLPTVIGYGVVAMVAATAGLIAQSAAARHAQPATQGKPRCHSSRSEPRTAPRSRSATTTTAPIEGEQLHDASRPEAAPPDPESRSGRATAQVR
jgi:MFS family permease